MKATCFLRIALRRDGRLAFNVTSKLSAAPLVDTRSMPLPTVTVKLTLDLPDDTFESVMAELSAKVPEAAISPAIELTVGEGE